jgi:hypothetical protein
MEYIYRLTHTIERPPEEDNDWIEIGIYSTKEKAEEAIQRASNKLERCSKYPESFCIDRCKINEHDCDTGFVTYWY